MALTYFDFFFYKKETADLNFVLVPLRSETHFLFKNLCSEVWRHFRAMRIIALMGNRLCFLMKFLWNHEILFTLVTTNQKNIFIYYNFLLKVIHTLKLSLVLRGSKTDLFQEHLVFLISDDIKKPSTSLSDTVSRIRKARFTGNEVGS